MTATTQSESTVAELKAAQLVAIEQSGWGAPFHLVQPHNLAFWVYVLGVGSGAIAMVRYFSAGAGSFGPALTGGVLLFGIYLVPWLLLLHHHNRYTSQPASLLVTGFVWGAVAATFWIALPANAAVLSIWAKLGGPPFASRWAAGLAAPVNEEWGKALGLVLLILLAPRLVRSAYDGLIIGAYIGLGFQVVEDVLYAFNSAAQAFGVNQVGNAVQIFVLRGLTGIVSHTLFSAIFCAGLMWVVTRTPGERHVIRGVLIMLMAMVFHFGWDDAFGLAGGNPVVMFAVVYPIAVTLELLALFAVLRSAARTERRWTRELLAPEVDAGTLGAPLLDAVSGARKDRVAYRKRLRSRSASRHRIEAAQDLAHEIAVAGGADTDQVEHSRGELSRLDKAR